MAEYVQEQDRLVSGKGLFRIQADPVKFRHAYLLIDVVREPRNTFKNFNWNPPRSKYAFLTFRKQGYVVHTESLDFDRQRFDIVSDITSQNLIAIKCAYDGVLETFKRLSMALAFTPGGIGLQTLEKIDLIQDYTYLSLNWDEVVITCYADTALQVRFFTLLHDTCDPDKDRPNEPPPPPPPLPKLPPGTPIGNIDPPYDDTDDITQPYPGDESPPPPDEPPGQRCTAYHVVVRVWGDWGEPDGFSQGYPYKDIGADFYGEVELLATTIRTVIRCHGIPFGECSEESQDIVLTTQPSDPGYPPREIVSFDEISPP